MSMKDLMSSAKKLLNKPSKAVIFGGLLVLVGLGVLLSYRIISEDPLCKQLRSEISRQERVREREKQFGSNINPVERTIRGADDMVKILDLHIKIRKNGIKCRGD